MKEQVITRPMLPPGTDYTLDRAFWRLARLILAPTRVATASIAAYHRTLKGKLYGSDSVAGKQ